MWPRRRRLGGGCCLWCRVVAGGAGGGHEKIVADDDHDNWRNHRPELLMMAHLNRRWMSSRKRSWIRTGTHPMIRMSLQMPMPMSVPVPSSLLTPDRPQHPTLTACRPPLALATMLAYHAPPATVVAGQPPGPGGDARVLRRWWI